MKHSALAQLAPGLPAVSVVGVDSSRSAVQTHGVSKRLQVLVDEEELEIRAVARRQGMTVAEWVRQSLRRARSEAPSGSVGRKLDALERASRHSYPAPDIE